jgi:hypothetical protein
MGALASTVSRKLKFELAVELLGGLDGKPY